MRNAMLILAIFCFISCNKYPLEIGIPPTLVFIDEPTSSDTIIVQYNSYYNDMIPQVYYAKKNWQSSSNPSAQHKFLSYSYRTDDSISIGITASSANSFYNYRFKFQNNASTLESQNLLEMPPTSNAVIFKRLQ